MTMKHLLCLFFLLAPFLRAGAQAQLPVELQDALLECNYTLAVQLLDKEAENAQEDVKYLIKIADAYRACNQTVKAIRVYERALALNPGDKKIQRQLVRLEMQLGNYDKGVNYCHQMLEADSTDAIAYRLLGNCYYSKREFDYAFMGYSKAYELNPDDFSTVDAFSSLLIEEKNYEDALKLTERYREKDTTNLRINQNNAEAYFRLNRYKEAIQRYKALEAAGDHSFYTLYFKGVSHFAEQDYYAAHHYLERARPTDPENVTLLYYLAVAGARTSWKDDAIKYMEQVEDLTVPSDSTLNWMYTGFIRVYPKWNPRYEEALLKMLRINPNRFGLLNLLGQTFEPTDTKKALEYYKRYVKALPEEERKKYPNSLHYEHAMKFIREQEANEATEKFWKEK